MLHSATLCYIVLHCASCLCLYQCYYLVSGVDWFSWLLGLVWIQGYPAEIKDSHRCVDNAMRRNCPVCLQATCLRADLGEKFAWEFLCCFYCFCWLCCELVALFYTKNQWKCVEMRWNELSLWSLPMLEDLFQSVTQVTILQCGHTIHQDPVQSKSWRQNMSTESIENP